MPRLRRGHPVKPATGGLPVLERSDLNLGPLSASDLSHPRTYFHAEHLGAPLCHQS